MKPEGLLEVGRIGRPHGLRGDLFVDLTSDREERAAKGSELWAGDRLVVITSSARSNKRWRVHFEGIDDRDSASAIAGLAVFAEPIEDSETLWVHQLIGAQVVEVGGIDRGVCRSVVANPAADLLELETGALVPVTFVTSVDAAGPGVVVTIDPPDGLFELL